MAQFDSGSETRKTSVDARITYGKAPPAGEKSYNYLYELPKGQTQRTNFETEDFTFPVTDVRSVQPFTLKGNGFQLEKLDQPGDVQWDVEEQIKSTYYLDVEKLLKKVTGASRVHIFDHTLRKGTIRDSKAGVAASAGRGKPVPRAHVDYTLTSGPGRLKELLPEEAETLQMTPYAVIQVWRPLRGPVQDSPLAVCDAATTKQADLLATSLHFPDRTGEVYNVMHNPDHRWYYAKAMETDEVYVFVCYDSREDGRARFTPHTSFDDPTCPPDAPERESIEIRAYAFWENEIGGSKPRA